MQTYLFLVPGLAMTALGAIGCLTVLAHLHAFGREWDVHSLIAGALLVIVGTQVCALGLCARAYATYVMGAEDPLLERMRSRVRLEHGLLLGGGIVAAGVALGVVIGVRWADRGFGPLSEQRLAIVAATLVIIGIQIFFSSFLLSILGLRRLRR
jgi:ABC-type uncharacterized transport system YnjBCD permease subunit